MCGYKLFVTPALTCSKLAFNDVDQCARSGQS